VVITPTANNTFRIEVTGEISPKTQAAVLKTVAGTQKQQLERACEQHNLRLAVARAPSQSGKTFAPLPQLCFKQGKLWDLLDADAFLHWHKDWSLPDYPAELPNFKLEQTAADMDGKKLT
jgi:type III restriction enzyme